MLINVHIMTIKIMSNNLLTFLPIIEGTFGRKYGRCVTDETSWKTNWKKIEELDLSIECEWTNHLKSSISRLARELIKERPSQKYI